MAAIDLIPLLSDTTFAQRAALVLTNLAMSVAQEDPATPNHAMRARAAYTILQDPLGSVRRMLWSIVQQPGVAAAGLAATDGQLMTAITAVVAAYVPPA